MSESSAGLIPLNVQFNNILSSMHPSLRDVT